MPVAADVGYLKQVQSLETVSCGAWLSPRGLKQAPQELFGLFPALCFKGCCEAVGWQRWSGRSQTKRSPCWKGRLHVCVKPYVSEHQPGTTLRPGRNPPCSIAASRPAGDSSTVFRRPGAGALSPAVTASCPLGLLAPQKGCTLLSGLFLAKLLRAILL